MANLIRHLVIPRAAKLNLRCTDSEPKSKSSTFEDFVSSLQQLFLSMTRSRPRRALPYHTLSVSGEVDESIKIKLWRKFRAGDKTPLLGPHLNLMIETTKSSLVVVPPLLKLLPMSKLQAATIYTEMSRKDLMATFGRLQHLKTLYADYASAQQILQTLSYKQRKDADANHYRVQFPNLQNLYFQDVLFSDRYDAVCVTIDELRDCLMDRCSRQVPIQTLGISASYDLDQEDISLLREIVVDVPWDGHRRCYGNVLNEEEEESEVYSGESDSEEGSEDSEDYSHVQIQRSTEDLLFILRNGCM